MQNGLPKSAHSAFTSNYTTKLSAYYLVIINLKYSVYIYTHWARN